MSTGLIWFWWILICVICLVAPVSMLFSAWLRNPKVVAPLIIPAVAGVAFGLTLIPQAKGVLVGADYTSRLFMTIDVFIALTAANAIYAFVRKMRIVALASALLCLGWLYMAGVNSVV